VKIVSIRVIKGQLEKGLVISCPFCGNSMEVVGVLSEPLSHQDRVDSSIIHHINISTFSCPKCGFVAKFLYSVLQQYVLLLAKGEKP
jgi:uncharacterized Zn finger protein